MGANDREQQKGCALDLSGRVAFVVSDAASYLPATTTSVDGGILQGSVGL
jgi:hypothetical protein